MSERITGDLLEAARPAIVTDGRIALVVRSRGDVSPITPAVLQAIRSLDPDQPVYVVRMMDDVLAGSVVQRRLNMVIIGVAANSSSIE